jgi:hypothetical protein
MHDEDSLRIPEILIKTKCEVLSESFGLGKVRRSTIIQSKWSLTSCEELITFIIIKLNLLINMNDDEGFEIRTTQCILSGE